MLNPNKRERRGTRHFAGELGGGTLTIHRGATLRDADTDVVVREPKATLRLRVGDKLIIQATEIEPWNELGVFVVVGKRDDGTAVVEPRKYQCRDGRVWVSLCVSESDGRKQGSR